MKLLDVIVACVLVALVAILCLAIGYRLGIDNAPQEQLTLRWDTPVYQEGQGINYDGLILGEPYVRPLWEVNNETAEVLALRNDVGWLQDFVKAALSDEQMRQSLIEHGMTEDEIAFIEGKMD